MTCKPLFPFSKELKQVILPCSQALCRKFLFLEASQEMPGVWARLFINSPAVGRKHTSADAFPTCQLMMGFGHFASELSPATLHLTANSPSLSSTPAAPLLGAYSRPRTCSKYRLCRYLPRVLTCL